MIQKESLLSAQASQADSPSETPSHSVSKSDFDSSSTLRAFLISCLVVALFLGISIFLCGRPNYETNDDVVMSMVASGVGFHNKPDEHLLYTHYLVGRLLNLLYTVSPKIAWYSVYLFAAQCISMVAMTFLIVRRARVKTLLYILPLFLISVCLRPTQFMQFTTTAALVSTAGALYLFEALEKTDNFAKSLAPLGLSLLFFMGGALIRFQSARAIVVLAFLFILCQLFSKVELHKLKLAVPFLIVVSLAISALEFENLEYYKHNIWGEFYEVNYPRFRLTEFGRTNKMTPTIVSAFKEVGWSPADNWMLARFYLLDRDNFSLEKLRKLDSLVPEVKKTKVSEIVSDLLVILLRLTIAPSLVGMALACLLLDKSKRVLLSGLLFGSGLIAASIFLLITMKLPVYVFAGLASCASASLLWAAASGKSLAANPRWQRLCAGLLAICFVVTSCVAVSKFRKESEYSERESSVLRSSFAHMDKKFLYVIWAYAFPYSAIRPFDDLRDYFPDMKLLGINFLGRTPINVERMDEFGLKDLMRQFDDPRIRLVSNPEFNEKIFEYVVQHFNKELRFDCTYNFDKIGFNVYKAICVKELPKNRDLNQQWCEYLAKMGGFQPGTGGDIVVSDVLGCHRPNPPKDTVIYPSSNYVWKMIDMKDVSRKRSLYFFKQAPIVQCAQCGLAGVKTLEFEGTGRLPTLSYYGALNLNPNDYSSFYIEVAAPPAMETDRAVLVEFNLPRTKKWKFIVPLQIDGSLHRYEFRLSKLNFAKGDRITDINVHPIYLRKPNEKPRFSLGEMGFVKE